MLYLAIFEKLDKSVFKHFTAIFGKCHLGRRAKRFSGSIFRNDLFNEFRCSMVVKTNDEKSFLYINPLKRSTNFNFVTLRKEI